jgi:large subunit ribosomal protein L22
MAKYSYSTGIGEKDAAAVGMALPISTKQAIEICTSIRRKRLERAKAILSSAINEKTAIPFNRFTNGVGHKKGKIAAGRYPKKACTEILKMLNSAQANAQFKGLSSSDLVVRHISAQRASTTWHYGRRRAQAKRTTIEVVLTESAVKKEEKKGKEPVKEEQKKEEKPEAKLESEIPNSRNEVSRKEKVAEEKTQKKEVKSESKEKLESEIPNSRNEVSRKPKEAKAEQ